MTSLRRLLLLSALICGCTQEQALQSPVPDVPVQTNTIGMKFVTIPAGEFLMGAPETDLKAEEDEKPQHRVVITQDFHLGQFEVTQAQYAEVMGNNPSEFSKGGREADAVKNLQTDQFPVEFVNWYEANLFCKKISELPAEKAAGRSYRLPTEAEWEYACRAGTTTRFSFGKEPDPRYANYLGDIGHPRPVGSYPPNPFGLYDMHGNVLEWCSDWHVDDYFQHSPVEDPTGPEEPIEDARVLRGGGHGFKAASSSFRDSILPNRRGNSHGFRVVMEVERVISNEASQSN
ncbi:formylglycine-generating enzyme family protein [Rubinisphaera italica]|uniref:Serine/threonine-protein kinase pkn1 n=1 Tax=Rubinisphaera italica TaxID=2527969 RepID=A0A5C5XI17_9PLAN|nr:formylglycine-generating enzyme family protein [Rubinisphaera italica]TWT62747.1 Serine/threonine-protein kinase pkn1 [Rubinisphaera italica]